MDKYQTGVREFMKLAGQPTPNEVVEPSRSSRELRARLILEEALEFAHASGISVFCGMEKISLDKLKIMCDGEYNLTEAMDAVSDTLYVTYGAAVDCGIDVEPINDEVWSNNLSKFIDGYRDESGKWRKGPSYKPVNLEPLINKQKNKSKDKVDAEQLTFEF